MKIILDINLVAAYPPLMPRREMSFPAERIHEARRRHMLGASQQEIAEVLGTSQGTAGRRIREWGWGPARIRGFRPCPPKFAFVMDPSDIMGDSADGAPDEPEPDLSARLKRLVAREMKRVEVCGGAPLDVARTLSSLAQTLKLLSTLPTMYARREDAPDYHQLERDLVQRLNQLVAEDDVRRDHSALEEFAARCRRDALETGPSQA